MKLLRDAMGNLVTLGKALAVASEESLSSEPLPGAGEEVWQKLYNAAKAYSIEKAYPTQGFFPVVHDNSLCVLCMQPLSSEAKIRMVRFKDFMEKTIKKQVETARDELDTIRTTLEGLDIPVVEIYQDAVDEIEGRDKELADELKTYLLAAPTRRDVMVEAAVEKREFEAPELQELCGDRFTKIINALEKEAEQMLKAAEPETLQRMIEEQAELLARKLLSTRIQNIKAYVGQLKVARKYDECIEETGSKKVTEKGKEILTGALTPKLQKALRVELDALNIGHIPLHLKATGSEGETRHKLELVGCQVPDKTNLTDILSEGEQHVVAVAGFLAELGVSSTTSPIIFDDPVCSLDHLYRTKIAERLAKEAAFRQVIVFTHDIAFLLELEAKAGESGQYFFSQTVLKTGGMPGCRTEMKPWHAMPVKKRLECLDQMLHDFRNPHTTDAQIYNQNAAQLYGLLRETWEAAVEEVLFQGIVVRHGSEIQTLKLRYVIVTDDDYKTIHFGMKTCSKWMFGHDKAHALDVNRPTPGEIEKDILSLRGCVNAINVRRNAVEKQRHASIQPLIPLVG